MCKQDFVFVNRIHNDNFSHVTLLAKSVSEFNELLNTNAFVIHYPENWISTP